ncbi:MAG TPA: hypothetical protein VMG59_06565 [Phycisphaerae bacterium]|nr:hypothetical protein [Phycisphaerae bacterium]
MPVMKSDSRNCNKSSDRAHIIVAGLIALGCAAGLSVLPCRAQSQNQPSQTPEPAWLFRMHAWPAGTSQLDNPDADAQEEAQQEAGVDTKSMMDNMLASGQRLQAGDPGVQTQQCQQKVVDSLNELIQLVAQMSGSCSNPGQKNGQKQSMQLQMNPSNRQSMSPSQAATNSFIPAGGALPAGGEQPMDSQRQQWGNLPPAARNLILNAEHSEALPDYQQQVDSYYRALGQINQQQQSQ